MNSEHSAFYNHLYQNLVTSAPSAAQQFKAPDDLRFALSPFVIQLPKIILEKARLAIRDLWTLSRQADDASNPWHALKNNSVLMAYDFHTNSKGDLRLIEINTNASGYLVSGLLAPPEERKKLEQTLLSSFMNEWRLIADGRPLRRIAIADKNLNKQKMFFEFEMFKDLFRSHGLDCDIVEWGQPISAEFVYNRHTDFYLQESDSAAIKDLALQQKICLSPSPKEYFLLADKARLAEWTLQFNSLTPAIQDVLLKTQKTSDLAPDVLWSSRKNLFFKPAQSYGGKSAYRGASITRKIFERLLHENFLAQEYFPPGLYGEDWKYDVRFYVYQDQVQWFTARLYQGQITNFQTPLGGFARIDFI